MREILRLKELPLALDDVRCRGRSRGPWTFFHQAIAMSRLTRRGHSRVS